MFETQSSTYETQCIMYEPSADMNETQGGVSKVGERSPTHVPRPTITPREMEEQALLNWAHMRITTITLSY